MHSFHKKTSKRPPFGRSPLSFVDTNTEKTVAPVLKPAPIQEVEKMIGKEIDENTNPTISVTVLDEADGVPVIHQGVAVEESLTAMVARLVKAEMSGTMDRTSTLETRISTLEAESVAAKLESMKSKMRINGLERESLHRRREEAIVKRYGEDLVAHLIERLSLNDEEYESLLAQKTALEEATMHG